MLLRYIRETKKWGIEDSEASKIIEYLIKQRFIDEARYAKGFTNDKFRFNKWGRTKIAYALRLKNSETLIDEALYNINEEQYQDTLLQILENKQKTQKRPINTTCTQNYSDLPLLKDSNGYYTIGHSIHETMKKQIGNIIDLFYPRTCRVCGRMLLTHEEFLCLHCIHNIPRTDFHKKRIPSMEQLFRGENRHTGCIRILLFYPTRRLQTTNT